MLGGGEAKIVYVTGGVVMLMRVAASSLQTASHWSCRQHEVTRWSLQLIRLMPVSPAQS